MSDLPSVSGRAAIAAFEKNGFTVVRIDGSHHVMKREGHRFLVSVPIHGNRSVKKGTLRGLIRAAGMTVEQFRQSLD